MKVLIISKPVYHNIMPLVDFPKSKDIFNLNNTIESIYGEANVAAYILGMYNLDVEYSGVIGNDEAGSKFKKMLEDINVSTKFIDIDYEYKTDVINSIINIEKGGFSHIKVNTMKNDMSKFKYDFDPEYIVFDDKDFSGANAALNNYPNAKFIFYGKTPNKDVINMCKRADYIVCNINFVSKLTGLEIVLNKPKTIIALYQRLIDLFKGEWIITLGEYGVIYCNENNVKMIPALKCEVVDRDKAGSVFFGTFAYSIISGIDIENAVRLANINASYSLNKIGATNGLMKLDELLKNKVIKNEQVKVVESVQNSENITDNNINSNLSLAQVNSKQITNENVRIESQQQINNGQNVNIQTQATERINQVQVPQSSVQPSNIEVMETLNSNRNE